MWWESTKRQCVQLLKELKKTYPFKMAQQMYRRLSDCTDFEAIYAASDPVRLLRNSVEERPLYEHQTDSEAYHSSITVPVWQVSQDM